MRFTRKIASLAVAVVTAGTLLVAGAGSASAVQDQVCDTGPSPDLCLNSWNGMVDGHDVRMYPAGAANNNFVFVTVERCNAQGTVTHTCPFTVGSGLNDRYFGNSVYQIWNGFSTLHQCVVTRADGTGAQGTCNNTCTGQGGQNGTLFVGVGSTVINVYWTNQTGGASVAYMQDSGSGNSVVLDDYGSHNTWSYDPLIGC